MRMNIEAKREMYEAAEAEYRNLIDHPVKTVSVREYKAMLDAAMKQRRRTYKDWRAAVNSVTDTH